MTQRLRAPFPYFGSKYDIADVVWAALGDVPNYVEPFAGSLACLLARPHVGKVETVNDKSGLVTNFWRAVQADPVGVAKAADNPVHELDLHAWHTALVAAAPGLQIKLSEDPRYFDSEIAGRWAWGASAWLGSGWCDGTLPKRRPELSGGSGRARNGHGVHGTSVSQLPHLHGSDGTGVGFGKGVHSRSGRQSEGLLYWMQALAERFRFVRVCCGDFMRVLTPSVTISHGLTGVVLDPTYSRKERTKRIYEVEDDTSAPRAAEYGRENGANPMLRIALHGFEGEHNMPGWTVYRWRTGGGYGNQANKRGKANAERECIWFSPHCLIIPEQLTLEVFDA